VATDLKSMSSYLSLTISFQIIKSQTTSSRTLYLAAIPPSTYSLNEITGTSPSINTE